MHLMSQIGISNPLFISSPQLSCFSTIGEEMRGCEPNHLKCYTAQSTRI